MINERSSESWSDPDGPELESELSAVSSSRSEEAPVPVDGDSSVENSDASVNDSGSVSESSSANALTSVEPSCDREALRSAATGRYKFSEKKRRQC